MLPRELPNSLSDEGRHLLSIYAFNRPFVWIRQMGNIVQRHALMLRSDHLPQCINGLMSRDAEDPGGDSCRVGKGTGSTPDSDHDVDDDFLGNSLVVNESGYILE